MSKAAAPSQLSAVRDFPDRVPAMLVKELRQGLRARLFAEAIAGFHLLIIVLMLPVVSFAGGTESSSLQRLVWWIFAAVIVLLLPLRGLSALISESRDHTLETLLLTNLKAGRIVRGKWLAISAQVLLTGISMLPYILLLYAGGGLSLPASVLTLLRLIMAGLVLTAAFVALSWNQSWMQRAVPGVILGFFAMNAYAWPVVALLHENSASSALNAPWRVPAEMIAAAALICILLSGAARRLAPGVENHQSLPRLLALFLPWAAWAVPDPILMQSALTALILVSLTALTEAWPLVLPPGGGWQRQPGMAAGWPHGIIWAVTAWGAAMVPFFKDPDAGLFSPALRCAAWLFCGRLLLWCGRKKWNWSPWWLAGTALIFALLQSALVLGGQLLHLDFLTELSTAIPVPLTLFHPGGNSPALPWIAIAAGAGCLLIALITLARQGPSPEEPT